MESDRRFDHEVHRDLDGEQAGRQETEHQAEAGRFREVMASYVDGLEEPAPELKRAVMEVSFGSLTALFSHSRRTAALGRKAVIQTARCRDWRMSAFGQKRGVH